MRFSLIIATAAVAAMTIIPVRAEEQGGVRDDTSHHQMRDMLKSLNLNADQQAKLKALRGEMKPVREATMEKVKALHEKAKVELLKATPGKAELENIARQLGDAHRDMALKEQEHLLKVKAILTPEQFEKILSIPMKGMKGMGHDGPGREMGPR